MRRHDEEPERTACQSRFEEEMERLDRQERRDVYGTFIGMVVGVALVLLYACGAFGAEPQFQVENRVPPKFEVVNKVAPSSAPVPKSSCSCKVCGCVIGSPTVPCPDACNSYASVYVRVQLGERLTWVGAPPGMPHGTYDCYLQNGSPVMVRREVSQTTRPFSQTPAVVVSGSTAITPARSVVGRSTSFPGVAPYQARIRTLAPPVILGGIENCGPLG